MGGNWYPECRENLRGIGGIESALVWIVERSWTGSELGPIQGSRGGQRHGGIRNQVGRRARPRAGAGADGGHCRRAARPLCSRRIPRLFRQVPQRFWRALEAQGQAGTVSHFQPAVSHADSRRIADSGLDSDAGQEPEERAFCGAVGRCGGEGEDGRRAFGGFRGAERLSGDVHHDAAGRRTQRQFAGGAGALCELPAHLAHLPQEAGGVADLSLRADDAGLLSDVFHVCLCDSAVCHAV